MEWKRQSKDTPHAEEIASFAEGQTVDQVRSLITGLDTHAIITWSNRPRTWEYWRREHGAWVRSRAVSNAAEAKHLAEQFEAEHAVLEEVRALPEGTALEVVAEWREPYHGSAPLVLPCSSSSTAEVIAGIFKRMGCTVTTTVAA